LNTPPPKIFTIIVSPVDTPVNVQLIVEPPNVEVSQNDLKLTLVGA
jgi:homogentisate 1,2-dioxygenase